MPEHGRNIWEVIRDTAQRKVRAAKARFQGSAPNVEAPRDIYSQSCAQIAEALMPDGYAYARSGQKLTRKTGDFSFQISFRSSRNNVSGELVALWIHANVVSKQLKKWRTEKPSLRNASDFVAGGQIGNLLPHTSWMEWNLASRDTRDEQIADAVTTIRRIAHPYFAMFDHVARLASRLVTEDVPAFWEMDILDFLMCYSNPASAREAAVRLLKRYPDTLRDYPLALSRFQQQGLPKFALTKHAECLAAATIIFGFQDLRNEAKHP